MGLTDETSASLAQIDPDRLSVKGRTPRYKGSTKTAAEIGQELSVDYLVESSLRAEGSRLRVTAKLIRVRDQEYVWTQSYEREPGQPAPAAAGAEHGHRGTGSPEAVAGSRRRAWTPADAERRRVRRVSQGTIPGSRRTPATNARAIEQFRRATRSIRTMRWRGPVWPSLMARGAINGDARPLDVGPLSRDGAANAVRAGPNLAESQSAAGYVTWIIDWDWTAEKGRSAWRAARSQQRGGDRMLGHELSQSGRPQKRRLRCAGRGNSILWTRSTDAVRPGCVSGPRVPGPGNTRVVPFRWLRLLDRVRGARAGVRDGRGSRYGCSKRSGTPPLLGRQQQDPLAQRPNARKTGTRGGRARGAVDAGSRLSRETGHAAVRVSVDLRRARGARSRCSMRWKKPTRCATST